MTGTIVWFTGLPASGKSTLAERTRTRLAALGRAAIVLDGDALREVLGAAAYGQTDRDTFYRVLADLAVLIARQDTIVLVAATAHRRAHRDRARSGPCRFFEVWVRASPMDCEARDIKGLYARAHHGDIAALPGVGVPFEAPEHPDVIADGGMDDAAISAVARLVVADGQSARALQSPTPTTGDSIRPATEAGSPAVVSECIPDRGSVHEQLGTMTTPRNILVPIDLGAHAKDVLDYAVALAGKLGAQLHVRHSVSWPLLGAELPVVVTDQAMNDVVANHRKDLDLLIASYAGKAPIASTELQTGDPRTLIVDTAAQLRADLIIMGTHGRRGVSRLLIGSVAEQVARTAPCPVLLVRSGKITAG